MIYTIGAGLGATNFYVENANYDKIIIMTDGYGWCPFKPSCNLLLYRYMRPLVEAGHVYITLPLYRCRKAKARKEKK